MGAPPGNVFEKTQVKSYYKSPRRTAPIRSTPRMEDRGRGEGGSLRPVPGRAGELHHRRVGAIPLHRQVSRLRDEGEAGTHARPVQAGGVTRRDPRSAEGALKAGAGSYSAFAPIALTSFPHFSTSAVR